MLRQQRKGQGKIGFEFANAGSIDQGRQHLVSRQYAVSSEQFAVGSKLEVTANRLLQTTSKHLAVGSRTQEIANSLTHTAH